MTFNIGDTVTLKDDYGDHAAGTSGTVVAIKVSDVAFHPPLISFQPPTGRRIDAFDWRLDHVEKPPVDSNVEAMKALTEALDRHTAALLVHAEALKEHAFQLDLAN